VGSVNTLKLTIGFHKMRWISFRRWVTWLLEKG
jgi:hypothetical protein